MTRQEIAQARLRAASEHVEAAQHELERAVSCLAALKWMYPEQRKVEVLRDRIHEAFYRLAPLSHARAKGCAKAELDREPEAGDEEPHKGCCVGYRPAVVPFDVDAYEKRKREHEAAGDGSDGREIAARNAHACPACLGTGKDESKAGMPGYSEAACSRCGGIGMVAELSECIHLRQEGSYCIACKSTVGPSLQP